MIENALTEHSCDSVQRGLKIAGRASRHVGTSRRCCIRYTMSCLPDPQMAVPNLVSICSHNLPVNILASLRNAVGCAVVQINDSRRDADWRWWMLRSNFEGNVGFASCGDIRLRCILSAACMAWCIGDLRQPKIGRKAVMPNDSAESNNDHPTQWSTFCANFLLHVHKCHLLQRLT